MVGSVEGSTGCNMVRRGEGEYSSKRIGGVYYEAFAWGRLCTGSSEQAGDSTLVLWAARIKGPPTPPCKASFDPERMRRGEGTRRQLGTYFVCVARARSSAWSDGRISLSMPFSLLLSVPLSFSLPPCLSTSKLCNATTMAVFSVLSRQPISSPPYADSCKYRQSAAHCEALLSSFAQCHRSHPLPADKCVHPSPPLVSVPSNVTSSEKQTFYALYVRPSILPPPLCLSAACRPSCRGAGTFPCVRAALPPAR